VALHDIDGHQWNSLEISGNGLMDTQPFRKVRFDEIEKLCNGKGWSLYTLANETKKADEKKKGVNVKTLKRWMSGELAHVTKVELVAKTFGVRFETLLEGYEETALPDPPSTGGSSLILISIGTRKWGIKVDESFKTWTRERQTAFVQDFWAILGIADELHLITTRGGCVELIFELTDEQAEALQRAFAEGRLAPLKVIGIRPLPEERFDRSAFGGERPTTTDSGHYKHYADKKLYGRAEIIRADPSSSGSPVYECKVIGGSLLDDALCRVTRNGALIFPTAEEEAGYLEVMNSQMSKFDAAQGDQAFVQLRCFAYLASGVERRPTPVFQAGDVIESFGSPPAGNN
jgi:hypothetical protein